MSKKLPNLQYHTVGTLAEEWSCHPERVEQYIKTGKLKIHIVSKGWTLQLCYIEKDENTWHAILKDYYKTKRGDFLEVSKRTAQDLIDDGLDDAPVFEGLDSEYVAISSQHHDEVVIRKSDIVIKLEDAATFHRTTEESANKENKKTREREIIKCIGQSFLKVKEKSKSKPSAENVWKQLKKDDHSCIQEINFCDQAKENVIFWKSQKGIQQKMLYGRFKNVVSEFNTGKKKASY